MSDSAQRLLDAEEAVHEVAQRLQALKSEIEMYRGANEVLKDLAGGLGTLVGSCSEVTASTLAGVRVLGDIGTPAILDRLNSLDERLSRAVKAFEEGALLMSSNLKASSEEISNRVSGLEEQAASIARKVDLAEETLGMMSNKLSGIERSMGAVALRSQLDRATYISVGLQLVILAGLLFLLF